MVSSYVAFTVNSLKLSNIFAKIFIIDGWHGHKRPKGINYFN